MPGLAIRCPACGHSLVTVDEPSWLTSLGASVRRPPAAPSHHFSSPSTRPLDLQASPARPCIGSSELAGLESFA